MKRTTYDFASVVLLLVGGGGALVDSGADGVDPASCGFHPGGTQTWELAPGVAGVDGAGVFSCERLCAM